MKKVILFLAMAVIAFGIYSCKCSNASDPKEPEEIAELVVENTISTDREDMFLNYGKVYAWFESSIMLKNFLDEEGCNGSIESVVNIFEVVKDSTGLDTDVVMFTHSYLTNDVEVAKHAFWYDDLALNEEDIELTFKEAFDKFMESNCPKPHSQYVVLRKPLGPVITNALYIFGNAKDHYYVDAKTGEVFSDNEL